jgi:hypothetical protein
MTFFDATRAALFAALFGLSACSTPSNSDEGTETSDGTDSTTSETSGETSEPSLIDGELEFVMDDTQPMVVDVVLRSTMPIVATSDVSLSHASDEGVHFAWMSSTEDGLEHHFRIRGLAPASAHEVEANVMLDSLADNVSGEFTTLDPLPGFEAEMPVEGTSLNPEGYRLFDWSTTALSTVGYMQIDPTGRTRWYWGHQAEMGTGNSVVGALKSLDDGSFLYILGSTIQQRDELGTLLREVDPADYGVAPFHHEVMQLPNGNLLTMSFEFMVENYGAEGDYLIAGDYLMEIDPDGELVWTWSSFEHLDTQRVKPGFHDLFPPIIDPVSGEQAKDWSHANGFIYNEAGDTILLSLRHQDWLVAIDHASGDVLYKLGPEGDFDLLEGTWFYHQHSPQWQPDGSLVMYDNGLTNPDVGDEWVSRAVRYDLDYDAMTATQTWGDETDPIQSPAMGDVDLMPGGQFLVTDATIGLGVDVATAHARVREMDLESSPQMQWSFEAPEGRVIYRAMPTDRLMGEAAQ